MIRSITLTALATALVLGNAPTAVWSTPFALVDAAHLDGETEPVRRIVRKGGWGIPGLRHSSIRAARKPVGTNGAYLTERRVERLTIVPNPLLPAQYLRARSLFVYDVGGSVFAYYLSYAIVVPAPSIVGMPYSYRVGSLRFTEVGAVAGHWYFDADGNGTFDTLVSHVLDAADPEPPLWTS